MSELISCCLLLSKNLRASLSSSSSFDNVSSSVMSPRCCPTLSLGTSCRPTEGATCSSESCCKAVSLPPLRKHTKTRVGGLPHSIQGTILQVHILHVIPRNFESVSRSKPIKELIPRKIEVNIVLYPEGTCGFIRPRSGGIFYGVSTATEEDEWDVHATNKAYAVRVALHRHIETPQFVTCERVGPALEDNHGRLEDFNCTSNDLRLMVTSTDN
jgi:hypothetical protein